MREIPRRLPDLVAAFQRNHLLTYASAIAFQVLTAFVPMLLFGFALMGFLDLSEVWQREMRPRVVSSVSTPALAVIDATVAKVLSGKQLFWVTLGAGLAIYQLSGAMRAAIEALNQVHDLEETRPWLRRVVRSVLLAVGVGTALVLAVVVVTLVPLLVADAPAGVELAARIGRYVVAALLLAVAVGLTVHHGPNCPQPLGWVSTGAALVTVAWLAMSALFGLYLTTVANYGSLFGNLATVVILLGYFYLSSITFLAGIQMDALLRRER